MLTRVVCVSLAKKSKKESKYKGIYTQADTLADAVAKVEAAFPTWDVTSVHFEDDFWMD